MIFQTRAGDYRKMGTEQCADGVTFTFQCPKELACAVVLFEKKTGKKNIIIVMRLKEKECVILTESV